MVQRSAVKTLEVSLDDIQGFKTGSRGFISIDGTCTWELPRGIKQGIVVIKQGLLRSWLWQTQIKKCSVILTKLQSTHQKNLVTNIHSTRNQIDKFWLKISYFSKIHLYLNKAKRSAKQLLLFNVISALACVSCLQQPTVWRKSRTSCY